MLAWQNFHQSRKDFLNFASFYYQRVGKAKEKKKEELH
jgi:predicted negative regulator of RcsB-dependent stress response